MSAGFKYAHEVPDTPVTCSIKLSVGNSVTAHIAAFDCQVLKRDKLHVEGIYLGDAYFGGSQTDQQWRDHLIDEKSGMSANDMP